MKPRTFVCHNCSKQFARDISSACRTRKTGMKAFCDRSCYLSFKAENKSKDRALYKIWAGIRERCNNPSSRLFKRYGGRGIAVCKEWDESFDAFKNDMGPRPQNTSVDRINNDDGYHKGNCRWATPVEQARNRSSNRWIAAFGELRTLVEWSSLHGIKAETIAERIRRGWSPEDAVKSGLYRQKERK